MLYKKYKNFFNNGILSTGFSPRFPDYAEKYKLFLLEHALSYVPKNCFLDIGAGSGRLSVLLISNYFTKGIALEVVPDKSIWNYILQQHKSLILMPGLLQEMLPIFIKDNIKVDFIILSELFEHIPLKDIDTFIINLTQILSDTGKIYLTTPNSIVQGAAEKSSRWYEKQPYGHHKHYNLKELESLFSNYGFKIDWHSFESSYIKRHLYNKLFYKTSRLDQKLLESKKLPLIIRKIYKAVSYPIILPIKLFFWILAQLVYWCEQKFNSENNSETIVLQISKKQ
jgi:hypothetical protein